MAKFPADLAKAVADRWFQLVAGEYVTPACPSKSQLRQILEACYLAANTPEEGRYPKFNVVVTEEEVINFSTEATFYSFGTSRPVTVEEIRRLAPATDSKKSAIWITFSKSDVLIAGICDLGTSWHRARLGLVYSYRVPPALIVQIDRPGKIKVFQGQYAVASLSDGALIESKFDIPLFLHKIAHEKFEELSHDFTVPSVEEPREFESFWFTALCNVFSGLVNSINALGHGGAVIVLPDRNLIVGESVRLKYSCVSDSLRTAFVRFINARNSTADHWTAIENGEVVEGSLHEAELILAAATEHLIETIRFTAQLAGCDGAIVISADLRLIGFGAEIRSELADGTNIYEVKDELDKKYSICNIEQFGMRHRSAVKLVSRMPSAKAIVISQDGPVSAVWGEDGSVFVRKGVALGNMNMPLGS
ncbi:putative sensor domain DACNV-containing protein [Allosphingosinicella indica]|uniref:putative sensor domain DACNV-containing protein n=1 Tax=Allosphingosinicella indica TaxID=941907 RepID=UPI001AECCEFD|nr:diadenylate cyclase [Allosphingosinicella indica]